MMTIKEVFATHGEAVAQLHHYSGGDPGYKNVLDNRVRSTAVDAMLAVLDEYAEEHSLCLHDKEEMLHGSLRGRIQILNK